MDQHLEEAAALNFLLSEDTTSSALPVMSPSEIDGYLAELENRPPLAPFSEVKKTFVSYDVGLTQKLDRLY